MNDEQFEAVLDFIRRNWNSGGSPVAVLRARDTAQREVLAQLEAERDTAIAQMQNIRKERDAINKDLGAAEFKLCIAQSQLASALALIGEVKSELRTGPSYGWEDRLAAKLDAFLAQAEQQKASNAEVARESLRPENQRIEPVEPLRVPHPLEAQGAQAGEFQREDRYIVIKRKDLEAIENSGGSSDLETHEAVRFLAEALDTLQPCLPKRECLVIESDWPEYEPTWAAIQARMEGRADLATQPAEWVEPVVLASAGPLYDQGFADGVSEAKRLNAVRGAEHDQ